MTEYYITDIESGERYPVSKEAYESYMRGIEACKPMLKNIPGVPLIIGTAGEMDADTYHELFVNTTKRMEEIKERFRQGWWPENAPLNDLKIESKAEVNPMPDGSWQWSLPLNDEDPTDNISF